MKAKVINPILRVEDENSYRYRLIKSLITSSFGASTLIMDAERKGDYELAYLIDTFDKNNVEKSLAKIRRWVWDRKIGIIGITPEKYINRL